MEQVTVTYGSTIGLPGYSSAKFEVSIQCNVEAKETLDKAIDRAYKIAEKQWKGKIEGVLDEVEKHLRK